MTPATSSIGHGRTVIVGPVRYAELCGTGRRMLLDHGFTLVENESTVPWTQAELHELLQGADAAVAGVEVYDAEALQHADRLQIISRLGVRLVATPAEAVADVDIVSVHAPHVPATHHIVDDALIAAMREGTILVNTARGGLVDQAALDRGLASGRIAGAGLDVFELEPTSADNPLFHHDNVVVAPHAAADSREAYERIGLATAQAIVDVFAGRVPAALVA